MVSPGSQTPIFGEANIARYLARLLDTPYDDGEPAAVAEIDQLVDQAAVLLSGNNKEKSAVLRTLNGSLGRQQWLNGGQLSLADIVIWSAVQQSGQADTAPGNVKKWLERCNSNPAFMQASQCLQT